MVFAFRYRTCVKLHAGILGTYLAVLGTASCITAGARAPHDEEAKTNAALTRANDLLAKGDASGAIKVATNALARARGEGDISQRAIAGLTEVIAGASFRNGNADSPTQFALALSAWEKAPNADEDIARVAGLDGMAMVLMNDDLVGAEQLYRRAIAILERLHGTSDPRLIVSLHYLLDVLDQECRAAEFQVVLAQLERIYDAHPGQECAAFYRARFHALAARRQGDTERALVSMNQAIAALEKSEVDTHVPQAALKRAAYDMLGNIALDGGHYSEASRVIDLASAKHVDEGAGTPKSDFSLSEHFDYEAAGDARLQTNDEKLHLRSAHAGGALFTPSLSPLDSCQPETSPAPRGWVFRVSQVNDLIARCFDTTVSPDAHVRVMMRLGSGSIVAAEAAGLNVDQAALECASHAVLAFPIPGPHDFNFETWDWDAGR